MDTVVNRYWSTCVCVCVFGSDLDVLLNYTLFNQFSLHRRAVPRPLVTLQA